MALPGLLIRGSGASFFPCFATSYARKNEMDGLQWGNIPEWVTITGNLGPVLYRLIQRDRQKRAQSWPPIVEELARLSPEAVQHLLESNPLLGGRCAMGHLELR